MESLYFKNWGKMLDLGLDFFPTPADIYLSKIFFGTYNNAWEFKQDLENNSRNHEDPEDYKIRVRADLFLRQKLKIDYLRGIDSKTLKLFENIWDKNTSLKVNKDGLLEVIAYVE